jgi:hypothetical protein
MRGIVTKGRVSGIPDCFRNANGENLFECLLELCAVAIERERPIIFVWMEQTCPQRTPIDADKKGLESEGDS